MGVVCKTQGRKDNNEYVAEFEETSKEDLTLKVICVNYMMDVIAY